MAKKFTPKISKFNSGDRVYCNFNKNVYILQTRYDLLNNSSQRIAWNAYDFENPSNPNLVLREEDLVKVIS